MQSTAPELPRAEDVETASVLVPSPWRRRVGTAVILLTWLYLACLVALWLLLFLAADRWWLGTVAMYGPRWIWAAPVIVLLPAAAAVRRGRVMWVLLLAAVVLIGPVMRFCVPWRRALAGSGESPVRLRVLTNNVDGPSLDPAELKAFIEQTHPDVVALQTWAARHQRGVFGPGYPPQGWHVQRDGELFFASRFPITAARAASQPPFESGNGALAAYDVAAPAGTVRVINLHLATPRRGLMAFVGEGPGAADEVRANIELRRRQTEVARQWVDEAAVGSGPGSGTGRVVVLGDFNTPTDSAIYREFWSPFANAFSAAGFGFGNTHFTEKTAIRIDHILLGPGWQCRRAWVGPHVGSGHRPVVADLVAVGGAAPAAP